MTHNNTNLTEQQIVNLPLLGKTINNWRQREITLLQHPEHLDRVISVGHSFDGKQIVIADEEKSAWATALDYAANGKVYESH